tara:strand:- start:8307 stop:9092 length:786 start_codon:yes stop_codon:yes gene_type:complete
MKRLFLCFGFLCTVLVSAQNFNDYKYIIVPKKMSSFKVEDEYRTSALLKYLFSNKGYTVVYDDGLPEDLRSNRCLGLIADIANESNMFTTKTSIVLTDCNSDVVFTSKEGRSKEKMFQKSYNEALRDAFTSFNTISYSYIAKENEAKLEEPVVVSFKDDVKKMEESSAIPVQKSKKNISNGVAINSVSEGVLYAQEIANGFQLVDSTPKIEYKIYKTTVQGYFMASNNDTKGVVINKSGKWYFEYYDNNEQLISKELNIKF